jgi:phenylacetate-coenzyme A ligase PaaK-like adenylate-forming protein
MNSEIVLPEWYRERPDARQRYAAIARWAGQQHPFYRKHAPASGYAHPILTRQIVQADNDLLLNGHPETARTSGSAATPVRVCWGRERTRREKADTQWMLSTLGGRHVASQIVSTLVRAASECTLEVSSPAQAQVEFLQRRWQEHGACALLTYPTNLELLARHILDAGLDFSFMRRVTCLSETYESEHDRLLRAAFPNAQAHVTYSCVEVGLIASRCPHRPENYHVLAGKLGVEVLDSDGLPCREGELGRIVVTDYHNRATPFIRYALGDMAVATTCDCGRIDLPALTSIAGRQQGVFRTRAGRRIIFTLFSPMFRDSPEIGQYQVLQDDYERFTVRCVPRPGADLAPLRERVQRRFETEFGAEVQVEYELLDFIPRSPGGKYFVGICRMPPE